MPSSENNSRAKVACFGLTHQSPLMEPIQCSHTHGDALPLIRAHPSGGFLLPPSAYMVLISSTQS